MLSPFVKWCGGKRQLLPILKELVPKNFNNYYEPFVGGGALLFDLLPSKAVINDINKPLMSTYNIIKSNVNDLIDALRDISNHEIDKDFYYSIRQKFNEKLVFNCFDLECCSYFLFLNKYCFNGLYRINSRGYFNTPFNHPSKNVKIYDKDNLINMSKYLQDVYICNVDFEDVLQDCKADDFVFIDSPYIPLKETSFTQYDKNGFGYEEHVRLSKVCEMLDDKGVKFILTNSDTELTREMYKYYNILNINAKRNINCKGSGRTGKELIITNFDN